MVLAADVTHLDFALQVARNIMICFMRQTASELGVSV
jgi:hypothetical protein